MSKGAIASIDLVFAIVIASVIVLSLTPFPDQKYQNIAIERTANDILVVLDKQNVLQTMDGTEINSNLEMMLSDNLDAYLRIDCYNHCSDIGMPCSAEFYKNSSLAVNAFGTAPNGEINVVKRFFVFEGDITNYCVAKMEVWLK